MLNTKDIVNIVGQMKNSRVSNYVIPGLDSFMIGGNGFGKVRLFTCSREHQEQITPHSHRFNFTCIVLQGWVKNHIWVERNENRGDLFQKSKLIYDGDIGKHIRKPFGYDNYEKFTNQYCKGEIYSMEADQIHSITFSRDCIVLFFEGPEVSDSSIIIEPVVDDQVIETYEIKDYMFKKEVADVRFNNDDKGIMVAPNEIS